MDQQSFITRYNNVKENLIKAMDEALERAIGNEVVNFDECEGNYLDVYPLIGAVMERELHNILGGGTVSTTKRVKRKCAEYVRDYRIWMGYAGDYRTRKKNGAHR